MNIKIEKKLLHDLWFLPALLFLLSVFYVVYPGGFSPDSHAMYEQAIGQEQLTDEKPVFTVLLMLVGIKIFGDSGFIIINNIMYFLGAALISSAIFERSIYKVFSLILLVSFPPLMLINLSNWVDSSELAGISLSLGLSFFYIFRRRNAYLLFGALFFSIWALLSRYNAASTIFFIQALISLLISRHYVSIVNQRFIAITLLTVIFVFSLTVNPLINKSFGAKHSSPLGWIYVNDLVGISLLNNKNLLPRGLLRDEYKSKSDEEILSALKSRYNYQNNWYIWDVVHQDYNKQFRDYAYRTIFDWPGSISYIRYQTNKVWLTKSMVAYTIWVNKTEEEITRHKKLGIVFNDYGKTYSYLASFAKRIQNDTIIFKAIWYLISLFIILLFAVLYRFTIRKTLTFKNESEVLIAISAAGLFTWLPMSTLIVSAEFRYLVPVVFFFIVSLLVICRIIIIIISNYLNKPDLGGMIMN